MFRGRRLVEGLRQPFIFGQMDYALLPARAQRTAIERNSPSVGSGDLAGGMKVLGLANGEGGNENQS